MSASNMLDRKSLADGLAAGDEWAYVEAILGAAPKHRDDTLRVLLYGPPGTGKTYTANTYGTPEKVYNVYLTEETPAAELRGHYVPFEGSFVWQDGPAIRAWREGARLVINEINNASGDALDFLLAILDDRQTAGFDLPTGERVMPHDGFHVVATMNGEPEDLPEALADRFRVGFRIAAPHPEALATLPEDIRAMAETEQRSTGQTSMRAWKCYRDLRETVGMEVAAVAVFGPAHAQSIIDASTIAR